jgi:hypothetical protein
VKNRIPIDEALAILEGTPKRLAALTVALAPAQLTTVPERGEWSANEVLSHLRSCADMWGGSIERILAEDHPTIQAVNPRTWIEETDYRERAFRPSLRAFTTQRAHLMSLLEPLRSNDWTRAATVRGAGAPLETSVHDYVTRLARHERTHVKQIERILNAASV